MEFIFLNQQSTDPNSILNPKNGWIISDVLNIIVQMVQPQPKKIIETSVITLSQKDLTPYKEKLLTYFFEDPKFKEPRSPSRYESRIWKFKSSLHSYGTKKKTSKAYQHVSTLKIFCKSGLVQCTGPDALQCKDFLMKNIFTDLKVIKHKIVLTNYTYNFGTNIDFAKFGPKIDPKLEANISQKPWRIIIKYSGITYIMFESGKMVVSCHNTTFSNSVLNYLHHLLFCYKTLERPLTFSNAV